MSKRVFPFTQGGVSGAAIQVAEADTWDLNKVLPVEHRREGDATVSFTYACACIAHGDHHVMVDGGWESEEIVDSLANLGVNPSEIDLVLITHGDGDHVLGLLTEDRTLTYPNANYVMHQDLWDFWHDNRALAELPEDRRTLLAALATSMEPRLTLFHDEHEVCEGIRAIPCPGHRQGHCTYEFATEEAPIHHFGDTLFHPLLAQHPDWPDRMAYDPPAEAASRRRTLERAASTGALVMTAHIAFPGIGRIERAAPHSDDANGATYRWTPIQSAPEDA